MIRYAIEGDINIELVKSTIKSEAQYIMPIPINTIRTSQGLIKQNPGY